MLLPFASNWLVFFLFVLFILVFFWGGGEGVVCLFVWLLFFFKVGF